MAKPKRWIKNAVLTKPPQKNHWIQKAVAKHPGKFSRGCPSGHTTAACIQKGLHSKNPTRRKEAVLARTFRSFHHTPRRGG
jgi:hypothetical protein